MSQRSLADLVGITAISNAYESNRAVTLPLAKSLSGIKRLTYDEKFAGAVEASRNIPLQDMIHRLDKIELQFDRLWVEGPLIAANRLGNEADDKGVRNGFLITANRGGGGFTFTSIQGLPFTDKHALQMGVDLRRRPNALTEGQMVSVSGNVGSKVTSERIDLDNAHLEGMLDRVQTFYSVQSDPKQGLKRQNAEADGIIDTAFNEAEFVTRAVIILATGAITAGNSLRSTPAELEADKSNAARLKHGKRPLLPTTSIVVDVARLKKAMAIKDPDKVAKVLLGVTDVATHPRTYQSGLRIFVKGHERKIPSPEDRRGAPRKVTASHPLAVTLEGGEIRKTRLPEPSG